MERKDKLTTACFFGYGLFHSLPIILLLMAAEDIMSGTAIQSSIAFLPFTVGDIMMKLAIPLVLKKTSLLPVMILVGFLWMTAYLLIVASDDVRLRLIGVFFVGTEVGSTNTIAMFLIARFKHVEAIVSAYHMAVNAATFLYALLYTGKFLAPGGTPLHRRAGMLVVSFRGKNQEFGIF